MSSEPRHHRSRLLIAAPTLVWLLVSLLVLHARVDVPEGPSDYCTRVDSVLDREATEWVSDHGTEPRTPAEAKRWVIAIAVLIDESGLADDAPPELDQHFTDVAVELTRVQLRPPGSSTSALLVALRGLWAAHQHECG